MVKINQASDILGHVGEGALLLAAQDINPAFFDLKTGFAGEFLQKAVNYRLKIAILLDGRPLGERFKELIHEHQNHPAVRFFEAEASARAWLS